MSFISSTNMETLDEEFKCFIVSIFDKYDNVQLDIITDSKHVYDFNIHSTIVLNSETLKCRLGSFSIKVCEVSEEQCINCNILGCILRLTPSQVVVNNIITADAKYLVETFIADNIDQFLTAINAAHEIERKFEVFSCMLYGTLKQNFIHPCACACGCEACYDIDGGICVALNNNSESVSKLENDVKIYLNLRPYIYMSISIDNGTEYIYTSKINLDMLSLVNKIKPFMKQSGQFTKPALH